MADLFALSDKILSEGVAHEPINRVNHQLSELDNDVAMVEAFSHSVQSLIYTHGHIDHVSGKRKQESSLMAKGIFGYAAI
jgi:cAMP phosphodiesterase